MQRVDLKNEMRRTEYSRMESSSKQIIKYTFIVGPRDNDFILYECRIYMYCMSLRSTNIFIPFEMFMPLGSNTDIINT